MIGVISDIHSNAFALEKGLSMLRACNVDAIYCLGDLIGYGNEPNEVIALIKNAGVICVKGNHEKLFIEGDNREKYNFPYTRNTLTEEHFDFLYNLPEEILIDSARIIMTHGFPGEIHRYFYANSDFDDIKNFKYQRIFLGHTHYPMMASYYDKKIINPGSLGQSRDGNPNGSFLICDMDKDIYEFRRLQ